MQKNNTPIDKRKGAKIFKRLLKPPFLIVRETESMVKLWKMKISKENPGESEYLSGMFEQNQ